MKLTRLVIAALALSLAAIAFAADTKEAKPEGDQAKTENAAAPAAPAAPDAAAPGAKIDFKSDTEKFSYALGMSIGGQLKMLKDYLDLPMLLRGLDENFKGTAALTSDEMQKTLADSQSRIQQAEKTKMDEKGEANKKAGEAFLEANKKKDGVKVTESGLQYKVIKEGDGPTPKLDDTVKVNYRGTLIDGTEFDSSYKHNEPLVIPVKQVIKGWTEALQLMKVGGKYELYIPSDLAYGPHGPRDIGPNSTLIFEMELLGIEKPESTTLPEEGAKTAPEAKEAPAAKEQTK